MRQILADIILLYVLCKYCILKICPCPNVNFLILILNNETILLLLSILCIAKRCSPIKRLKLKHILNIKTLLILSYTMYSRGHIIQERTLSCSVIENINYI
jgi:hypothetical protein